jgi:hypothetical protein
MSIRSLLNEREDHTLKRSIRNAFALLTNAEIQQVCSELTNLEAGTSAAMIIELVGPEATRVASILPTLWEPAALADGEIASKVVVAAAGIKGSPVPRKEDVRRAIDNLDLSPADKSAAVQSIEKVAVSALDWALIGKFLGDITVAILARKFPMLRVASRIPFGIRAAGAVAGAAVGVERALPPMPEE